MFPAVNKVSRYILYSADFGLFLYLCYSASEIATPVAAPAPIWVVTFLATPTRRLTLVVR